MRTESRTNEPSLERFVNEIIELTQKGELIWTYDEVSFGVEKGDRGVYVSTDGSKLFKLEIMDITTDDFIRLVEVSNHSEVQRLFNYVSNLWMQNLQPMVNYGEVEGPEVFDNVLQYLKNE